MQRDLVVKGRSLGSSSDLTLLAAIKPGFVDSIESVTYKTRIKRVLESLHGARMVSHEQHEARLLSDSIERVGVIQSVRVAVLEPEEKVLLAVTFDGSWESYIRILWDKVGTLLDLIFCGTVDYVTSYDHSFDEWLAWAYRVQIETGFFYGPPDFTARDACYHRRAERMRLRIPNEVEAALDPQLLEMRTVAPTAEVVVSRIVDSGRPRTPDDPQVMPIDPPRMIGQRIRIGLRGLAALYRLTDLHRPFTPDGDVLHRAARDLLREFVAMHDGGLATDPFEIAHARFERQLEWLFSKRAAITPRIVPAPADTERDRIDAKVLRRIQGGIVRPYDNVTHGLAVLVALPDLASACDFFDWAAKNVTIGAGRHDAARLRQDGTTPVYRNVAVTVAGLRAAGATEDDIELFPEEFRQGMAARAGLLGDVRNNHPQRWRRPRRFESVDDDDGDARDPDGSGAPLPESFNIVDLDTVDAVVQFQTCADPDGMDAVQLSDDKHPLRNELATFMEKNPAVTILAVQSLKRNFREGSDSKTVQEHFGYADGLGQPDVEKKVGVRNSFNRVHLGEIVCGHDNAADYAPDLSVPSLPADVRARLSWLADGSFLVVRKYRQFVDRLERAIDEAVKASGVPEAQRADFEETAYAKLMGRRRDGKPLVPGAGDNNFLYGADPDGKLCPLRAHIRLANPRVTEAPATSRTPRIMRRGMSYGPPRNEENSDANRGLLFMAYNASISEQYEVIQRWLSGGNSTGSSSAQGCPFVGVPENGLPRFHRFEYETAPDESRAVRVKLEGRTPLFEEPEVLVRLEWGLYLFAPSLAVLRRLSDTASRGVQRCDVPVPWQIKRGRARLAALQSVRETQGDDAARIAWKAAIEDAESIDRLEAAALWAAIREDHGGLLKTPYGTLVADRDLVDEVLMNAGDRYSVRGQLARMNECFGEVFLGMDDGPRYREESGPINASIAALSNSERKKKDLFRAAFKAATRKLDGIAKEARTQGGLIGDPRFEVSVDVREVLDEVLADLADSWFGLNDQPKTKRLFRRGSPDWQWQSGEPPLYPGHFTALSRYIFQPNPGATPKDLARQYGNALRRAMDEFVTYHWKTRSPRAPNRKSAPIAKAAFDHESLGQDPAYVSKTLVGVLMGLNPTIIGAVLNVVRELQRDGSFNALRKELAGAKDYERAHEVLDGPIRAAACMRPMPQLGWRTATMPHRLTDKRGRGVDVATGDVVVVATVSATQQSLAAGDDAVARMFGGDRSTSPHPVHACPGYVPGWETIVGTVAALLTRKETMRQGVGPLAFVLEGRIPRRDTTAIRPPPDDDHPVKEVPKPVVSAKRNGLVMAWGDSWLDYSFLGTEIIKDLRDWLGDFGYRIPRDFCQWTTWTKIDTMAKDPAPFCRFVSEQIQNAASDHPPLAILLSGGGNDSTGRTLWGLLNPSTPRRPFDRKRLDEHIGKLKKSYEVVIAALRETLAREGSSIPILVHGYDYPLLGGKGYPGWLAIPFEERGYDRKAAVAAMRTLIDRFNIMLAGLETAPPPGEAPVRYVDLRGTIERYWGDAADQAWANDLHPMPDAFGYLALKIDSVLVPLIPPAKVVAES